MGTNPYASPSVAETKQIPDELPTRENLSKLIEQFLESKISAFDFDERLEVFYDSDDPIIRHVVNQVWYHYDDLEDHFMCFTKQQWDFFQRLLLVLAADCRVKNEAKTSWSVKQLVAAGTLIAFIYSAIQFGWGQHLLMLSVPFGIVSIFLSFWKTSAPPELDPYEKVIFPFATFSDLAKAYRSSGFQKTKYPKHIDQRSNRAPLLVLFCQLYMYAMWLFLSPLPLLFQSLPDWHSQSRVVATSG